MFDFVQGKINQPPVDETNMDIRRSGKFRAKSNRLSIIKNVIAPPLVIRVKVQFIIREH